MNCDNCNKEFEELLAKEVYKGHASWYCEECYEEVHSEQTE